MLTRSAGAAGELAAIRSEGLFKDERVLASPQDAHVRVSGGARGTQPLRQQLPRAGRPPGACSRPRTTALDRWGFGMASVRFICGTQEIHKQLEQRLSEFLGDRGHDPVRLLLRRQRRPVRDAARRARTSSSPTRSTTPRSSTGSASARRGGCATPTATWTSSAARLREADGARRILIATDGVFSMDGYLARLDRDLRAGRARTARW